MNEKKSITNNSSKKELELGKYLESDMIALTDDDEAGGASPLISAISAATVASAGWVSNQTCPTTACTRAC